MTYAPQYPPTQPYPAGPGGLDQPLRGAGIGQAFARFWKKYATFSGRASRSEYWWMAVVSVLVSVVISIIGLATSGFDVTEMNARVTGPEDILNGLWGLATLIPSLALAVRRLHDTDRSGWWILLGLIPLIGWIILIVWYATGPNPAGQRFDKPGYQV